MTRIYTWHLAVRSYEGDAWGMVPAAGILRYFEQAAVAAAADGGYGAEFHREHGTAWIVRRVTLLMHAPAQQGDELELTTWASHFVKVRGGREYKLSHAGTGEVLWTGIAEWVYVDRGTLAPRAIPPKVAADFDVPGALLQRYDPPEVGVSLEERERIIGGHPQTPGREVPAPREEIRGHPQTPGRDFAPAPLEERERIGGHPQTPGREVPAPRHPQTPGEGETPTPLVVERVAEWHEVDANGHVNNAVYADWLDDAMRAAMAEHGRSVEAMREEGLHLRGEYYNLNYRRAALPGDRLRIVTRIEEASGGLYGVRQEITDAEGGVVLEGRSVYGESNA